MTSNAVPVTVEAEQTLGAMATRIASDKAKQWVDQTFQVIRKKVLDMSEQGLFHCTIRFEDTVPQDPVNQERILKLLAKQNLKGEFKTLEESVELYITWGHHLL
eukprot:TRINITY_DN2551_c0_g1_i1.p2 TRINITY_DN2551_c0_g1~~TRINITY_DN2551_c0_g1_i1.p2  ORF type:complete len:104 (+),score=26.50 TRINITY_DN2551_c0_g1_i1:73-384(+)